MLLQMRNMTRGFVAWILLGLLVIATAIWGISDFFTGVGAQNVAEVGGRSITPAQLSRELELTLRGQRQQGQNISQAEAIEAGIHLQLLESMIARNAFYAYAEDVGVSASNQQVANYIREIPRVLNPVTGEFDEAAYAAFLSELRYTQTEFEDDIRGDLTSQMLIGSLVSGIRPPSSYGALLFAYQTETRVVSVAEAPASAIGAVAPPNDAQLQAFYEESQEQLRLPEFRALTLVIARPADFVARVTVPEARLREEFDARAAALTQPERRSYVRLSAQTEAQANEAAARLTRGESPEAIAQAMGLQVTSGTDQSRAEVPDARVAEAVFTQARGVPRAVQGQLTPWAAVRVDAITPAQAPRFEDLRDELRDAIAADEAAELLNTAIGAFEDARAAGGTIAEAARTAGLPTLAIPAVEAGGRDTNGAPVEALVGQEEVLNNAFQTPEGEASDFMPIGDADVVVSVDSITPSSVRPLEEVRAELAEVWVSRERARRLRELGAEMVSDVQGGQSFADAARANRFRVVMSSQTMPRPEQPGGLPAQLFAAREGQVITTIGPNGTTVLVGVVEAINRANPAEAPQMVEALRAQWQDGLTGSLAEAIQNQVADDAGARRNQRLIDTAFPNPNAAADGAQ